MKRLVVFDLDGTLAESKSPIDAEMTTLLAGPLDVVRVAIISGGGWPQFQKQLLSHLARCDLTRLSLLPVRGTQFYEHTNGWRLRYSDDLTPEDKAKINAALDQVIASSGVVPARTWGDVVEDETKRLIEVTVACAGGLHRGTNTPDGEIE